MTQSNIVPEAAVFIPADSDKAFEAILPELMALSDEDTLPVNLDAIAAAMVALGRIPALNTLRAQIAEELPRFDLARFDKLEQYAHTLVHAHGLHRGAQLPKGRIAELGNELVAIRDRLYGNAKSLAENGLLDAERLKECKTAIGYRATVTDIYILVPLFKEYWPSIEGKTPITPAVLHDATTRAARLLGAVGLRTQASEVAGEKAQLRTKAFTLFVRVYEEVRHAVEYLRRNHGDAHEFAPSLYAGRGRRREESNDEPTQTASPQQASAAAGAKPDPTSHVITENPENLPLDNPFTSN